MTAASIEHQLNSIVVEQRVSDGFINGTAMCVAHGKDISDWLKTDGTWDLVTALANDLEVEPNPAKNPNSIKTRVSATYPSLAIVKRGSPENGGGVWLHPDLAIQLAQWCNPFFAIQVSRWVREWIAILEQNRRAEEDKRNKWRAIAKSTEPFPVDLDDAIKWWDCRTKDGKQIRRDNLVRKLKANYYEGVNYTLLIFEERVKGCITTPDKYFLTIECFKMMGMQVSGERGHEIRRYFLNCEAELKRRLQEDEKQRYWKIIKACVLPGSVAIAAYPDARYRSASANSIAFTFVGEEGVQLFLRGITFYSKLRLVVVGVEVVVTYLD